ncbi:MAG: Fe(3+) dicitrate ABC transporter permease subunit FecD, partial [Staphylococcus epidermidis]|nr:Fe(3+) dicitrate ABC transporter permease subunit FecD [Staphylococcus epidermidis]
MIKQNLKMRYTIVLLLLIFSTIFSLCIGSVMINP